MLENQKMLIVGLTGQTGAGKSTLSRMFAGQGVTVIDADAVARDTMEHSKKVLMDLVLEFSTEVIHPDATLNRKRLAEICFGDKQKLKKLNKITYPYIVEAILHKIEEARANGAWMVLLDAPTLYEAGLDSRCDLVVAVLADRERRLQRIIARDHMTPEEAELRINAQHEDDFYRRRTKEILLNNEDEESLRIAFLELFGRLRKMAGQADCESEQFQPSQAVQPEEPMISQSGDLEELTGEND